MKRNAEIKLPSDKDIISLQIDFLENISKVVQHEGIFPEIKDREREAYVLSIGRALNCARNIKLSLGVKD